MEILTIVKPASPVPSPTFFLSLTNNDYNIRGGTPYSTLVQALIHNVQTMQVMQVGEVQVEVAANFL